MFGLIAIPGYLKICRPTEASEMLTINDMTPTSILALPASGACPICHDAHANFCHVYRRLRSHLVQAHGLPPMTRADHLAWQNAYYARLRAEPEKREAYLKYRRAWRKKNRERANELARLLYRKKKLMPTNARRDYIAQYFELHRDEVNARRRLLYKLKKEVKINGKNTTQAHHDQVSSRE
jgi:hypothetical protein